MALREASKAELSIVLSAVEGFRSHWASYPTLGEGEFAGAFEDIDALDYLNYEGLGYPESGMAGAALVWGNVLATSGGYCWFFEEELGGLVLGLEDTGQVLQVIWPFGRVYELEKAWQSHGFHQLTAAVVAEGLARRGFRRKDRDWLRELVEHEPCVDYLQRVGTAIERLRG